MKSGIADLPLHWGAAPPWLFGRMVKLSKSISKVIISEFGQDEYIKRLSDPFWFQAFSCVLGWDFHSSGATTVTTAALKESNLSCLGVAVLGGKGSTSRKTPNEIEKLSETFAFSSQKIEELKRASKLAAKVDSAALQDQFQLYHHCFIVTEGGKWAVIQQGMKPDTKYARRYHWLSDNVKSFVDEPHTAICCDVTGKVLNMVAKESEAARKCSVDLVKDNPSHLYKYLVPGKGQKTVLKYLHMSPCHEIELNNYTALMNAFEQQPENYEELLLTKGMGSKTVRALALISNLIFGAEVSWSDPVKYSFCVGGKDGVPYPVDRKNYDIIIELFERGVTEAKLNDRERIAATKRLNDFYLSLENLLINQCQCQESDVQTARIS